MHALIMDVQGETISDLDLNDICKIDDGSRPIFGFFQPMVTATFVKNDDLFINVFHRETRV